MKRADALLERVVELRAAVEEADGRDPGLAVLLADAVEALDRWLFAGKPLPARWEKREGDRLTEEQRLVKRAMRSTRAAYSDDSYYGLLHEVAHMCDLDLPTADFPTINTALEKLSSWQRMEAEVVAHAVARAICAETGFPVFPDSVGYAATSTLKFARSRGEVSFWTEEDFKTSDSTFAGSERVMRATMRMRRLVEGQRAKER